MLAGMYLCASTIEGASFQQRLEAASAGEYAGIGLRPGHYQAARAGWASDSDLGGARGSPGLQVSRCSWPTGG